MKAGDKLLCKRDRFVENCYDRWLKSDHYYSIGEINDRGVFIIDEYDDHNFFPFDDLPYYFHTLKDERKMKLNKIDKNNGRESN